MQTFQPDQVAIASPHLRFKSVRLDVSATQ